MHPIPNTAWVAKKTRLVSFLDLWKNQVLVVQALTSSYRRRKKKKKRKEKKRQQDNMQSIRNLRILSPKWEVFQKSLSTGIRELGRRGG